MNSVKRKISTVLAILMLLSIITPTTLNAAGTPTIELVGIYTPDASGYVNNDINNIPKNLELITRLTNQNFTIRGNFYNFDQVQVENFYFTVTSVRPDGTHVTVKYDRNKPILTSNNSFEFRNVILNEGLNKIMVYSVNGDITSKAGWVYYHPVVTITDVRVNQEPFYDGVIVPKDPENEGTGLMVSGYAPNAESVLIQVLGEATPYSGYYNAQTGYFQFKVDSIRSRTLSDIKIDGGDQQFDIIATNATQKMTSTKKFIYNDGLPFTFENIIGSMNPDGSLAASYDLVTQPVINGETNKVYLEGSIKADIDQSNGDLIYNIATIKIPNGAGNESVVFHLDNLTATPNNPGITATIELDASKSTPQFSVYNYTIRNMFIDSGNRKQSIMTEFTSSIGMLAKPIYNFDYINTNLPYISEVRFADSNITVVDGTQVNELPIRLRLVPNSTSVDFVNANIYYDGNKPLPNANNKAETIVSTAGQTTFNLSPGYKLGDGSLAVLVNGVLQQIITDYQEVASPSGDVNSNIITFTNGLNAGDRVSFINNANTLFESYTASAGQTLFTLQTGYKVGEQAVKVYKNNVLQTLGTDFNEANGRQVSFNTPLNSGDKVVFVYDTHKVVENYRGTQGQTILDLKTIYTMGNGSLNVYKNGVYQTKGTHYNETGDRRITFTSPLVANDLITVTYDDIYSLAWLPEGIHNITFVPVDSYGNEQRIGNITRSLTYVPMQYIIISNIYNGQIFNNFSLTTLEGRLVNVPSTNDIKAYVGDKPLSFIRNADETFTADVAGKLVEGKNIITFRIVDSNNDIIAESTWEIFVFTSKAPMVDMDFDAPLKDYFVRFDEMPQGQYATKQKSVTFVGTFYETSTLHVNIFRKGEDGSDANKQGTWTYPYFNNPNGFNNTQDQFSLMNQPITNGTSAEGQFELVVDLSALGTTTIQVQVTNASGIISNKTFEITREPLPYEIVYPNIDRTNIINSNFVRIEMLAEGADGVEFKDGIAKKDWIYDRTGKLVEGFVYEIYNLKAGKNKIKFSVLRGQQTIDAEIELINANTVIEGAMHKSPIDKRMKVFNGLVELEFPKGTLLHRNDDSTINPYLSDKRQILFGIAEDIYGRVDKYRHPIATEIQKDRYDDGTIIDNFYPTITSQARIGQYYLTEPTGRFIEASPLIWIDGGVLKENASSKDDIILGSGKLPYERNELFYERNYKDLMVPTQRGTITLKYNENIRADSWPYLTIYHFGYNPDKGIYEWQNIGGVVDTKKKTITAPLDNFGYYRVMYMNQSFDDIVGHSWARIDLETLYSKGIMKNKFNDQFVPEQNITRGEFVTLLVKAFELPLNYEGQSTFYDVFKNPYFVGNALYEYKYIETAARYGIVRGQLEGTFAPNENITRQDAAVMIARAADLKTSSITDDRQVTRTKANLQKLFTDANLIDYYAAPSIEAVVKAGLMNGKPNVLLQGQKKLTYRFDPRFELKRSEAARIVLNVMKQQKKVPK